MPVAAVDLFCGVGGLTHGLELAGVPVVVGVDVEINHVRIRGELVLEFKIFVLVHVSPHRERLRGVLRDQFLLVRAWNKDQVFCIDLFVLCIEIQPEGTFIFFP